MPRKAGLNIEGGIAMVKEVVRFLSPNWDESVWPHGCPKFPSSQACFGFPKLWKSKPTGQVGMRFDLEDVDLRVNFDDVGEGLMKCSSVPVFSTRYLLVHWI